MRFRRGRHVASSNTLMSVRFVQHAKSMYRSRVQARARRMTARSVKLQDSISAMKQTKVRKPAHLPT